MAVKLSKRMAALASMITPGLRLADVGTDHGYIPIYLCQTGAIPSAVAMDINKGPLQRADEHIASCGLEHQIQTRLSDGLQKLLPGEADVVLIAGMGGGLVQKILSEGGHVLGGLKELIVQPQSEIPQTRAFLRENGWQIVDEDMIEEDGKYYPMIKAIPVSGMDPEGKASTQSQTLGDEFGPILLEKKHPVLLEWMKRELHLTEQILERLSSQGDGDSSKNVEKRMERRNELADKRRLLMQALQEMEGM